MSSSTDRLTKDDHDASYFFGPSTGFRFPFERSRLLLHGDVQVESSYIPMHLPDPTPFRFVSHPLTTPGVIKSAAALPFSIHRGSPFLNPSPQPFDRQICFSASLLLPAVVDPRFHGRCFDGRDQFTSTPGSGWAAWSMPPARDSIDEDTYSHQENALRNVDERAWFKRHPYGTHRQDTKPWGEWCSRWLGQQKLWFFQQWNHTSNLPPHLLDELMNYKINPIHLLISTLTPARRQQITAPTAAIGPNTTRFGPPTAGNLSSLPLRPPRSGTYVNIIAEYMRKPLSFPIQNHEVPSALQRFPLTPIATRMSSPQSFSSYLPNNLTVPFCSRPYHHLIKSSLYGPPSTKSLPPHTDQRAPTVIPFPLYWRHPARIPHKLHLLLTWTTRSCCLQPLHPRHRRLHLCRHRHLPMSFSRLRQPWSSWRRTIKTFRRLSCPIVRLTDDGFLCDSKTKLCCLALHSPPIFPR